MRRLVGILGGLLLAVSACAADPPAAETTTTTIVPVAPTTTTGGAAEELPSGGVLRLNTPVDWVLNPLVSSGWEAIFAGNLWSGAWRMDGMLGEPVPDLLAERPTVANGGLVEHADGTLTVRYRIHPDAVWSDGVPVTGADFEYSYRVFVETLQRLETAQGVEAERERLSAELGRDPTVDEIAAASGADPTVVADVLEGGYSITNTCGETEIPGPDGWLQQSLAIDPGSLEVGEKTFGFTLGGVDGYDADLFRYVLPRHVVEGTDPVFDWLDRLWPSAGPFVVESFDPDALLVTATRNDAYWRTHPDTGQPLPLLDGFVAGRLPEFRAALPDVIEVDGGHDEGDEEGGSLPLTVDTREFDSLAWGCGELSAFTALEIPEELIGDVFSAMDNALLQAENSLVAEGVLVEITVRDPAHFIELADGYGIAVNPARALLWEHVAFHYGENRLLANPESLVEHVEFRRAVAHALDRDRIAAEAYDIPSDRVDRIIDVFSATLEVPGGLPYSYDPDRARALLDELCDRLERDCATDPPSLYFAATDPRPHRQRIAALLDEMLTEVGIEVDVRTDEGILRMLMSCEGWEASNWAFGTDPDAALGGFDRVYSILDPGRQPFIESPIDNAYAWGTDAVEGVEDDPIFPTPECDESTLLNQGPSAVRNEFTELYADLYDQLEATADPAEQQRLVLELEQIIADRVLIIPLLSPRWGYVARDDIVGGVEKRFGGVENYWNLEEWYLVGEQVTP